MLPALVPVTGVVSCTRHKGETRVRLYCQQPVKMTTSSVPRQRNYGRGADDSYSSEEPSGGF